MRITSCVPCAGQGVIARYGQLVAVTDGRGPCPDPLLSALAEVAEAAGDGSDLVLSAARAALSSGQHAAFACAGVMSDGGVAVLVHGRAVATVGVLVLDDGTRFALDGDYVLGREPALDGDVLAGRARSLRINDPNGSVSRLHLKISLVGWQVEVSDLGSANGSLLQSPDGERRLTPFEPTMIEPGARIGIGHRSMQYLAYQGVHP
jgi:hypothetical protein